MKVSLVAVEPNERQPCIDCSVRQFSVCAALDRAELRELEHLGRHVHFASVRDGVRPGGDDDVVLQSARRRHAALQAAARRPPADRGICVARRFSGNDGFGASQLLRRRDRARDRLPVLAGGVRPVHRGQVASAPPDQRIGGSRAEPGAGPHGSARSPLGGRESRDLPDRLARSAGPLRAASPGRCRCR